MMYLTHIPKQDHSDNYCGIVWYDCTDPECDELREIARNKVLLEAWESKIIK